MFACTSRCLSELVTCVAKMSKTCYSLDISKRSLLVDKNMSVNHTEAICRKSPEEQDVHNGAWKLPQIVDTSTAVVIKTKERLKSPPLVGILSPRPYWDGSRQYRTNSVETERSASSSRENIL
jgi:hypothetical protein